MAEPARQMDNADQRMDQPRPSSAPTLAAVTAEIPASEAPARPADVPARAPAPSPAPAPAPSPAPARKRRSLRGPLLLVGPLLVLAAATWLYLGGGRFSATDNSYIKADVLAVATDVSGIVADIAVKEGQAVRAGDLLYRLDDEPFRIALDGARAQLGIVANQLNATRANYSQARAQVDLAKADLDFYTRTNQRQTDLVARNTGTQAALDQARRDYLGAQSRLLASQRQVDALMAQLGGKPDQPIEQNAQYLQARAAVDKAERDLRRTRVLAPIDGIATNVAHIQPGAFLAASQIAFNIVSRDHIWVDANLKETDLTNIKIGDPATITVDAYPGRVWTARVESIAPATAGEFSVLPAQNASGNWVKVVQRLTVRLAVDRQADAPELRAGMSVYASVDTGKIRTLATLPHELARMFGF
jgi:membrane fusion protein, multidrug efflux system